MRSIAACSKAGSGRADPAPTQSLERLREAVGAVEGRWSPARAEGAPAAWEPLSWGAVHEWLSGGEGPWLPPLAVLGHVVGGALGGRRVCWVGKRCWVYPCALPGAVLGRSVFVDAPRRAERVWAMDQALRAGAVVVGDGGGLTMGESRRLELAAGAGGALGLVVRPLRERGELSAARTRWVVAPAPGEGQGWVVELVRSKGALWEGARRWAALRDYETGDVRVVPEVRGRSAAASGARRAG